MAAGPLMSFLDRFRWDSCTRRCSTTFSSFLQLAFPRSFDLRSIFSTRLLFSMILTSIPMQAGPKWFPPKSSVTRLPLSRAAARHAMPFSPIRLSARCTCWIRVEVCRLAEMASANRGPMPRSLAMSVRTSFSLSFMRIKGRGESPDLSHAFRYDRRALPFRRRRCSFSDLNSSLGMSWYIL